MGAIVQSPRFRNSGINSSFAAMIHILGAGSIGSLIAWHLAKSGLPVTLLLRSPSPLELLHGRMIKLDYQDSPPIQMMEGGHECHVGVESCSASSPYASLNLPIRNLIVATKANDVVSALTSTRERLDLGSAANILLIQNGSLGVFKEAREIIPSSSQVSFGICTHGAYRASTTHIVQRSLGGSIKMYGPCDLSLNCLSDSKHKAKSVEASDGRSLLIESLSRVADLNTEIINDHSLFMRLVYQKLAVNCAINPVVALLGCYNKGVTTKRGREIVSQVSDELFDLLGRDRLGLDSAQSLVDEIINVASSTGLNMNSMLQDLRGGKETEIDYLNGYIARWADQEGLKAPVNSLLSRLIKAREEMDAIVV